MAKNIFKTIYYYSKINIYQNIIGLETVIHRIKNDKKLLKYRNSKKNFRFRLFVIINSFYGLNYFRNKKFMKFCFQ